MSTLAEQWWDDYGESGTAPLVEEYDSWLCESSDCETCGSDYPSAELGVWADGSIRFTARFGCYGGESITGNVHDKALESIRFHMSFSGADTEGLSDMLEAVKRAKNLAEVQP